jgi:hypothetical protein
MTPSSVTLPEIGLDILLEEEPGPEITALLATSSDPDTLRYNEAMATPDSDGF